MVEIGKYIYNAWNKSIVTVCKKIIYKIMIGSVEFLQFRCKACMMCHFSISYCTGLEIYKILGKKFLIQIICFRICNKIPFRFNVC